MNCRNSGIAPTVAGGGLTSRVDAEGVDDMRPLFVAWRRIVIEGISGAHAMASPSSQSASAVLDLSSQTEPPSVRRPSAKLAWVFKFVLLLMPALSMAGEPAKPSFSEAANPERRIKEFFVHLRQDTQTLARLVPVNEPDFDFVPSGRAAERQADGYAHIGDLNLRLRTGGSEWRDFSSSAVRTPIRPIEDRTSLAAADITLTMGPGLPLTVERRWIEVNGLLVLRFSLLNSSSVPVEIGGLGLPMVFDNILAGRTLEQAHTKNSFVDPYIGLDAGYLQVTRLNGKGPALLVLPDGQTPLEAWRPLPDRSAREQTSEGFYDWTVASKAYAEREWKNAGEQWNVPHSFTLAPGERRSVGVRFTLAPSIRTIEKRLIELGRPVAVGVPGYVIPTDLDGVLFLHSPRAVSRIESSPRGALVLTANGTVNSWRRYTVQGRAWGPARLSITYVDGSTQTVSYFVTKPLDKAVADLGRFTTTQQWFDDTTDPFRRAPAILTYDGDTNRVVTGDPRVWISGMSDEGGAGAWVAAVMKQLDNPVPFEVGRLERLINETVVGKLQLADGPQAGAVRKSLFYYDPKGMPGYYDPAADWTTWTSWPKLEADDLSRAYNYPHVAIGHWVMYRLARNHPGLVKTHTWRWYLDHAYGTVVAMMRDAPEYAQFGLMEGDVFVDLLKDLKREGMDSEAATMEGLMKQRANHWRALPYPFGSEMPWDSTGQAEVYAWLRYFGYREQADVTREVILGYDPVIPSWGYNGNARRYWDFLYGGKIARVERQIHHYGSALNAVPLFDAYREDPTDLYLLRIAYGGLMGAITNIDRRGFASAAFHAWPDMMRWDAYTGDYGMGFFGHAYAAATYVLKDPVFGWLSFGGNLKVGSDGLIHVTPKDSARTRLFFAPNRCWITLEAGKIDGATFDPRTGAIVLQLGSATPDAPAARILVTRDEKPLRLRGRILDRDGYSIPLTKVATALSITPE
jgi:hypothetical protein